MFLLWAIWEDFCFCLFHKTFHSHEKWPLIHTAAPSSPHLCDAIYFISFHLMISIWQRLNREINSRQTFHIHEINFKRIKVKIKKFQFQNRQNPKMQAKFEKVYKHQFQMHHEINLKFIIFTIKSRFCLSIIYWLWEKYSHEMTQKKVVWKEQENLANLSLFFFFFYFKLFCWQRSRFNSNVKKLKMKISFYLYRK